MARERNASFRRLWEGRWLAAILGTFLATGFPDRVAGASGKAATGEKAPHGKDSAILTPRPPLRATLTLTVTPGKPGAPSEIVAVIRNDAAYTLRVSRADSSGKILGEQSVKISPKEFASVWESVYRQRLLSFVPEEKSSRVFDFGTRRMRIEAIGAADAKPETKDVTWRRPIKNEDRVAPFMNKLAELAKLRAKSVELHYLVPNPSPPK